jgi:hypothetical protein
MVQGMQEKFQQSYKKGFRKFGAVVIVFVGLAAALAQDAGVSAGGKWLAYSSEDKMTAAKKVRFELPADNEDSNDDTSARVLLFCSNGKYELGDFRPNTKIAGPNRPSFWGRPQMTVTVRVDQAHDKHNWNWVNGHFLAMDKDTVRELIGAQIFKIQFMTPRGPQIAEFSPAGLDLPQVQKACDLKPKKP